MDCIFFFLAQRPTSFDGSPKKKIIPNKDLLQAGEEGMASPTSSDIDILSSSLDSIKTPEDLTTPDVFNNEILGGELEWGGNLTLA